MEEIVSTLIVIGCACLGVLVGCTAGSIINYRRTKSSKRDNNSTTTDDSNLEKQLGRVTELYEKATKLIQEKLNSSDSKDSNTDSN